MTYTAGIWFYEDLLSTLPDEPASIVSIDHEKSELTLMDAKPKAPTVQAVIAAYEALYDHDATLFLFSEDGRLRGALGWGDTCTTGRCSDWIDPDCIEVVFAASGETLDEVLADLAAQLHEEAQTPVARFDKVLGLLAT